MAASVASCVGRHEEGLWSKHHQDRIIQALCSCCHRWPRTSKCKGGSGTARDLYSIEDAVTDAVTERIALNLHWFERSAVWPTVIMSVLPKRLPIYQIIFPFKLENNCFPSRQDKAEAFVNIFSGNSLSSNLNPSVIKFKKEEEQKEEYKDAIPNQWHNLNSPLQYDEFIETLKSFASNTTAVGIDGTSYQMLTICFIAGNSYCINFYQKCWLNDSS